MKRHTRTRMTVKSLPPQPGRKYFRVEAILEAPTWALWAAIALMTVAVVAMSVAQFDF